VTFSRPPFTWAIGLLDSLAHVISGFMGSYARGILCSRALVLFVSWTLGPALGLSGTWVLGAILTLLRRYIDANVKS
jgi:hypothetical protein